MKECTPCRKNSAPTLAFALFAAWLSAGCLARQNASDEATFEIAPRFRAVAHGVLARERAFDHLLERGPVRFTVRPNIVIDGGSEKFAGDLVLPFVSGRAPLVILQHGNHSRKEAHREHAEHLASHGFVALSLQMPNRDRWVENGRALARIVQIIAARPEALSPRIEPRQTILVGHSFGGSAATLAAAREHSSVVGVILLDPAVVSSKVEKAMAEAKVPALLLGADRNIFRSRRRPSFARLWAGPFAEVSVLGSTHDDAQSPSMFALSTLGFDPFTSERQRAVFRAGITAGAFALAEENSLDFAWRVLLEIDRRGLLLDAARRQALVD